MIIISRVRKPGNKFVNGQSNKQPSKVVRVHAENEDYHNAQTLSAWLFQKYDMSYKSYRRKPKHRRDELREEFEEDTGIFLDDYDYAPSRDDTYDECMELLYEMGVPFAPDGTPLGIGGDD